MGNSLAFLGLALCIDCLNPHFNLAQIALKNRCPGMKLEV